MLNKEQEMADLRRKAIPSKWSPLKGSTMIMLFVMAVATPFWFMLWGVLKSLFSSPPNPVFSFALFFLPPAIVMVLFRLNFSIEQQRKGNRQVDMRQFAASTGFEYIDSPENIDGFNIVAGSVIAAGKGNHGFESGNFFRGTRNGYTFRAIDYNCLFGRGGVNTTIICLDIHGSNLKPFSLLINMPMSFASDAKKIASKRLTEFAPKGFDVVVDQPSDNHEFIPSGILMALAGKSFDVEFLGNRILVYRFKKILTGDDLLQGLDFAVGLAKKIK